MSFDGISFLLAFALEFAKKLFQNKLTTDVERNFFNEQFKPLNEAIEKGLKIDDKLVLDKSERNFIKSLKFNAATFATFKNHSFSNELVKALVDDNGEVRSWQEFKAEAEKLNQTYNEKWLKTEYDTTVGSSVMAGKWQDFQRNKHLYPNLKYRAVSDGRTREAHRILNGIILPIEHSFWNTHYPPNDWGCRCDVTATDESPTENLSRKTENGQTINFEDMPKLKTIFNNNVGKTAQLFNEKHPYYKTKEYDKVLKQAKQNFEHYKLDYPNYKKKGNIEVSEFADEKDLQDNMVIGDLIAKKLNFDVKIRPHVEIAGKLNPEYLINNLIGDRKSPTKGKITKLLQKAKEQECEMVVFDLENYPYEMDNIINRIKKHLENDNNYQKIKEVIVVSKDKNTVKHFNREELKKQL